MSAELFRAAMSNQAGGVAIISAGAVPYRTGLTATAVCSVSDAPPTVLVCINKSASAHDPVFDLGVYGVNFLASEQTEIADVFSGRTGAKGEERYAAGTWDTEVTGAPLLRNAAANLDCRVVQRIDAGTHTIFMGQVETARHRADAQPLVYFRSRFATLG